jgi:hypothetical protein
MHSYAWRFCKKCHVPIISVGDFSVDGLRKRKFRCNKCGKTFDFKIGFLDLLGVRVEYIEAFENLYRKVPTYMEPEKQLLGMGIKL